MESTVNRTYLFDLTLLRTLSETFLERTAIFRGILLEALLLLLGFTDAFLPKCFYRLNQGVSILQLQWKGKSRSNVRES